MNVVNSGRSLRFAALLSVVALTPQVSKATVVEFQTVLGNFEVNLYDNSTPQTVANFLDYVNNGAFTNSIIHRSVPGFVVQGGGFVYDLTIGTVPENPPVINEPVFANVRGTIAMAKLGGDPNSATSQWFFNLADNTANLDGQNGGFTAFGEVIGDGMDVVDAIAALPRFNFGGALTDLPLRDYDNLADPDGNNYVIITAVVVSDSTVDSAAGLNPPLSTNVAEPPTLQPPASGGGGGGSLGVIGYLGLLGLLLARRRRLRS
jgi:peptidyl-prolyl cis-trans isomerase A (cyclophilin A)